MDHLNHSRPFGGMLAAEFNELQQTSRCLSYPAGANVFQEGDPGDGLYMIGRGRVQITCLVTEGQRRVLSRLGPGDFFGEMAVLDSQTRSATATAETEVELHFFPREDLLSVLERKPGLAVSLMKEFSQRLREFNHRYTEELLQSERLTLIGKFARSIVHDFKNPLNIIGISAEMAAMDRATLEMRQSARDRIRKQVDRLSNMINELLEFTRGSGSTVVLARSDYAAFVRPLLEEMQSEVAGKGVTLELANEPPAVPILMDSRRLTHVFHNLIHNACDAMVERGGRISVRFEETPSHLVTEVRDSGRGIAPEIQPRLFEAFATFGKSQGTGLGLSICKKIVEDHRGRISARNAEQGGAIFTFTLPLGREPAPAATAAAGA